MNYRARYSATKESSEVYKTFTAKSDAGAKKQARRWERTFNVREYPWYKLCELVQVIRRAIPEKARKVILK